MNTSVRWSSLFVLLTAWLFTTGACDAQDDAEKVKSLIEAIKARGEPVSNEDLRKNFPIRRGVEDVTATWLEGMKPLAQETYKNAIRKLPVVGEDSKLALPEAGPVRDECDALLEANQYSLRKFYEAASKGGFARFPVDYSKYYLELPHVGHASAASRLMRLELQASAFRGDGAGVAKSLKALFRVWRIFDGEPVLVSRIVVSSRDRDARRALSDHLGRIEILADDLLDIQAELRNRNRLREMQVAFLGERVISYEVMQDLSQLDEKIPKGSRAQTSDVAFYLEYMQRHIASLNLDCPEMLREQDLIEANYIKENIRKGGYKHTVSGLLLPLIAIIPQKVAEDIAGSHSADAGIAVELYRREHGKLPDLLDMLVPKYLPSVPVDPFNGRPMIYKVGEKGFWIYSVGKNKADDGGKLDSKTGDEGLYFPLK